MALQPIGPALEAYVETQALSARRAALRTLADLEPGSAASAARSALSRPVTTYRVDIEESGYPPRSLTVAAVDAGDAWTFARSRIAPGARILSFSVRECVR